MIYKIRNAISNAFLWLAVATSGYSNAQGFILGAVTESESGKLALLMERTYNQFTREMNAKRGGDK